MNLFYIISDVFISAMAVFGLWCLFHFLMIDLTKSNSLCCAIIVTDKESLKNLGETLSLVKTSHLLKGAKPKNCDKYPVLLMQNVTLTADDMKNIPKNAELYVRIDTDPEKFIGSNE